MRRHGGKRHNAGRKVGSVTRKGREIAAAVLAASKPGDSMLDLMVANARYFAQQAADAEAALALCAEEAIATIDEPEDQVAYVLNKVKAAAGLRVLAQNCAEGAARYLHAPIGAVVGGGDAAKDEVPLAERLKAYASRDALKAPAGAKVVSIRKRAKGR